MDKIIDEVKVELGRQVEKWGIQNHNLPIWLMILGEEVGEANEAALEAGCPNGKPIPGDWIRKYRKELIQVAAVAISAVDSLDRNS